MNGGFKVPLKSIGGGLTRTADRLKFILYLLLLHHMHLKSFVLNFALLLTVSAWSQSDSLDRIIAEASTDTERIQLLLDHGKVQKDSTTAFSFFAKAERLASALSDPEQQINVLLAKGFWASELNRNCTQAIAYFDQALEATQRAKLPTLGVRVRSNICRCYRLQSKFDKAESCGREALSVAEADGVEPPAGLYFTLGVVYDVQQAYERSIEHFLEALRISTQEEDQEGIAYANNSLGVVSEHFYQFDRSLDYYADAKAAFEALGDEANVAMVLNNIGAVNIQLERYETGEHYILRSMEVAERLGLDWLLENNYQNLAAVYANHLGDYERALAFDRKNYELAVRRGRRERESEALSDMAQMLLRLGRTTEAKQHAREALRIAREMRLTALQINAHKALSEIHRAEGQYDTALDEYVRYAELTDSVFKVNNLGRIDELQVKYQTAEKEKLIQEQQLQLEREARKNQLLLLGGLCTLLLGGGIFLFLLQRHRYSRRIAEQRAELQTQRMNELEKNQKLRTLEAILEGQEVERKRIARDLHDGLGGLLSTTKLHFNALEHKSDQLPDLPLFKKTEHLLDDACREVRRIAHNMMPDALSNLGLINAVEDLAENISAARAIKISVQNMGVTERPDETTEVMLYRVVQELINNALRHADAQRLIIQFSQADDQLTLVVEDDGRGFDPQRTSDGMGLKSIQSRVQFLNGQLEVDAVIGEGSTFIITVPIRATVPVE